MVFSVDENCFALIPHAEHGHAVRTNQAHDIALLGSDPLTAYVELGAMHGFCFGASADAVVRFDHDHFFTCGMQEGGSANSGKACAHHNCVRHLVLRALSEFIPGFE